MNTRLRPERALARAWPRPTFAEQSTLEALQAAQLDHLGAGNTRLLRQDSQLRHHNWAWPVIVDLDPTSLLASKRAGGSRKGWGSGKKTAPAAMCSALPWLATMRVSSPSPIPAIGMGMRTVNRRCTTCCRSGRGPATNGARSSCAAMPNKAPMPTSPISYGSTFGIVPHFQ